MRIALHKPKWGKVTTLRQTSQFSGLVKNGTYLVQPNQFTNLEYELISDLNCRNVLDREK